MPPASRSAKTPQKKRRATKTSAARPPRLPAERATKTTASGKTKDSAARAKQAAAARATNTPARSTKADARAKKTRGARGAETTVVIIGAGRLGSALALALDAAGGYRVTALVSRRRSRALRAARRLRPGALALSADQLDQLPVSDLLIIATPDAQIELTAARLAAALPVVAPPEPAARSAGTTARARAPETPRAARRPVALHASGSLSSEALSALRARGFRLGSLHPLVSVSDPVSAAGSWRGAFFCVEGDAGAARAARRIVRALAGRAFSVRAEDKALYHAAAVLAAGHAVALFDLAARALAACGLPPRFARRVLLPLARSNLANIAAAPTNARALTGPFARADVETVRRNLAALAARDLGGVRAVYSLLGLASLALAGEAGADAAALAEIARAISKTSRG